MRSLALVFTVALVSAGCGDCLARAQETPPSVTLDQQQPDAMPTKAERINALFETLKTATDDGTAQDAERTIIKLWLQSGSDTVDLLMTWALAAMEAKKYPRALDFLDRIVIMKPDYAEGWNKRATVYFLMEDYGKSISDIGRVLALEPRHFGALSGLGMIMHTLGDDNRAITAYQQALAADPHLDNVRSALDEIESKAAGQDL
jgi:tetratricopeptide (TPR) repeat protein